MTDDVLYADMEILDHEAIRQATAQIEALASSFVSWGLEGVERAIALLAETRKAPANSGSHLREVFDIVHNVKGQAATFGYAFVSDVSAVACNILREQTSITDEETNALSTCCTVMLTSFKHRMRDDGGERGREVMLRLRAIAEEINQRRAKLGREGAAAE